MFEDKLREAIQLLLEYNPIIIYLFGSASRNELIEDSDIDIAFLSKEDIDEYDVFMKAQELADIFKREVDLIDISKSSTVFKAQIVGNGKVIYCSDDKERMFFEMRAFKEYVLFNDERKCIIKKIKERGYIYGKWCNFKQSRYYRKMYK